MSRQSLSFYIIVAVFLFFLGLLFYFIDEIYLVRTSPQRIEFQIKKGEDLDSIIGKLEEEGFVRNGFLVKAYTVIMGIHRTIKPGIYTIGLQYSAKDIFDRFVEGADIEVQIMEGWTINDIAETLKEKEIIKESGEFIKLARSFDNSDGKYKFLPGKKNVNLEGYLFPDTYKFERASVGEVIGKMLDNFDKKVYSQFGSMSQDQLRNVLIMASLLEKEVQTPGDMGLVAGILWKRFESEIPLQVDATLVYIKCILLKRADCRSLSNSDKEINSLYNTYRYAGLPPGPISNPGLKAIRAAFNPTDSPFWYYLSAKDDSRTIFSRTLEEHNLNKTTYR